MMKTFNMFKSFKFAINGVFVLLKTENNAKFHLLFLSLAVLFGFVLNISSLDWCLIILCAGFVFMAEAFNSAIEKLCDLISKDIKPEIKIIKDIAAAGVLFAAIASFLIGLYIFLPKIMSTI